MDTTLIHKAYDYAEKLLDETVERGTISTEAEHKMALSKVQLLIEMERNAAEGKLLEEDMKKSVERTHLLRRLGTMVEEYEKVHFPLEEKT